MCRSHLWRWSWVVRRHRASRCCTGRAPVGTRCRRPSHSRPTTATSHRRPEARSPPISTPGGKASQPSPLPGDYKQHLVSVVLFSKRHLGCTRFWVLVYQISTFSRVEPREAKMEVTLLHEPPCLVNEFYKIKVTIRNVEGSEVSDLQ